MWLDNEPAIDPNDILDELLLDGDDDEYFDQHQSAKRKRISDRPGAHTSKSTDMPSKRRKMSMEGHVPDGPLSKPLLLAPIVVWRTQDHNSVSYPIVRDGIEAGVALLEDWRERFKESANKSTRGVKRHSSQRAFAVVVERRQKKDLSKQHLFPLENTRGSIGNQKSAKSQLQDVQRTGAPRRNAKNNLGSTATAVQRPALAQMGNAITAASMKRKAPHTDDEDDELQVHGNISARPKKRVMTETKRPSLPRAHRSGGIARESKRKESEPESEAPKLRTKRSTVRPKTATVANAELIDKTKVKSATKRSNLKKS